MVTHRLPAVSDGLNEGIATSEGAAVVWVVTVQVDVVESQSPRPMPTVSATGFPAESTLASVTVTGPVWPTVKSFEELPAMARVPRNGGSV